MIYGHLDMAFADLRTKLRSISGWQSSKNVRALL
jgi:hypothetical protein